MNFAQLEKFSQFVQVMRMGLVFVTYLLHFPLISRSTYIEFRSFFRYEKHERERTCVLAPK